MTDLCVVHVLAGVCGIFEYGLREEGRGLEVIEVVCNAELEKSCRIVFAVRRVLVVIEYLSVLFEIVDVVHRCLRIDCCPVSRMLVRKYLGSV